VAGTGIEVWEMMATYRSLGKDLKRFKKAYHWLTSDQLRAALAYYSAFPEEIDRQIAKNEEWNNQKVRERHPFGDSPS
jgi:uncharacterized protein (DUF433 family)